MHRLIPLLLLLALAPGCPKPGAPDAAQLQPSAPLPADGPLLHYENLRLGMSNLEVAQAYNAPSGKGNGFTRGVEDYGDVRNHVIEFTAQKDEPKRKLVLRMYQDKLVLLVDRRDGLTAREAQQWLQSLLKTYGKPRDETLPGAQWTWGDKGGVTLTYTQDNKSDSDMSANVVLQHEPSYEASKRYLEYRETHK